MITVKLEDNVPQGIRTSTFSSVNIDFKTLESRINENNAYIETYFTEPGGISYELITNDKGLLKDFEDIKRGLHIEG